LGRIELLVLLLENLKEGHAIRCKLCLKAYPFEVSLISMIAYRSQCKVGRPKSNPGKLDPLLSLLLLRLEILLKSLEDAASLNLTIVDVSCPSSIHNLIVVLNELLFLGLLVEAPGNNGPIQGILSGWWGKIAVCAVGVCVCFLSEKCLFLFPLLEWHIS
jgi:hypothetical protein